MQTLWCLLLSNAWYEDTVFVQWQKFEHNISFDSHGLCNELFFTKDAY